MYTIRKTTFNNRWVIINSIGFVIAGQFDTKQEARIVLARISR